jgi:GTPase
MIPKTFNHDKEFGAPTRHLEAKFLYIRRGTCFIIHSQWDFISTINSGTNISMVYSNFLTVNQRNHCIFQLSNKPFHVCIGEILVFLDGPTGNPKIISWIYICLHIIAMQLIICFPSVLSSFHHS